MYEDLIDLGKEYYIWLKKEKKDRQQFVYPLPQHLTKNQKALRVFRKALNLLVVPKAGLEPARRGLRLILSQVRLPIPPLRHV